MTSENSTHIPTSTLGYRLFFYGPSKIGLTTFAQGFSEANYVCFNNPHLSQLKVKSCNIETMDEFRIWIKEAYKNPVLSTYVFDNFDGFQDVLCQDIASKAGVNNINHLDYGFGFFEAIMLFKKVLTTLNKLITKGHNIVFLGHSMIIASKIMDTVDSMKYTPKSYITHHKGENIGEILCNWVDGIFFVNLLENSSDAVCYTSISPFHLAGNRFNIKGILELDANQIESRINYSKGIIKTKPS